MTFEEQMSKISEFKDSSIWESEESIKKIRINEIPVMISDAGEIVCIPESQDLPTIGYTGMKAAGKSRLAHRVLDCVYWYQRKRCVWLNDYQRETITYTEPNMLKNEGSFDGGGMGGRIDEIMNGINYPSELNITNEIPMPLPTVYFYPNTLNLNYPKKDNHFKLSIPFEKIIRNSDDWLILKESRKYFDSMKDDLLRNSNNLDGYFDDMITNKKLPANLINKIRYGLGYYINNKIVDFSDREAISELTFKEKDKYNLNPIIATYVSNLVPSIVTSDVITKPYYAPFFKNLLDDIFKAQTDLFHKEEVWLFVDELPMICMTGKKKSIASESFENIVTTGRPARIGMNWITQNYSKVPPRITSNTNYLFTLRQKSSNEARQIAKDMQLKESERERIQKLKKFQIMAITNDEFICYKNGERYKISDEPIFGTAIPPLSLHKSPKDVM